MNRRFESSEKQSNGKSLVGKRLLETLGLLIVGDGLLTMVQPKRHVGLWSCGPRWWQSMMGWFRKRPVVTSLLGAAGVIAGLMLASRQEEPDEDRGGNNSNNKEKPKTRRRKQKSRRR